MQTIKVTLPRGRQFPGSLRLTTTSVGGANTELTLFGPIPVLGRADSADAARHGNPDRNPLKPYGDTPTGTFACTVVGAGDSLRSYGPHGRILLRAVGGAALLAAGDGLAITTDDGHRAGLMIHGGAPGNGGGLRPTHGCLRLSNENMAALLAVLKEPVQCIVSENTSSGVPTGSPTGVTTATGPLSSGAASASTGSLKPAPTDSAPAPTKAAPLAPTKEV